jgi:hypothetical protein
MRWALLLFLLQPANTIDDIVQSGRVVLIGESPSDRLAGTPQIAPGQPPLLSFRYLEGHQRGRFSNLDLVLDDAGH